LLKGFKQYLDILSNNRKVYKGVLLLLLCSQEMNYGGKKMDITKDEFDTYEDIRKSGLTNMFDIKNVMNMSGMSKDKIISIMENYDNLTKRLSWKARCKNE